LHQYLFNQPFAEAHNATADVEATTRCFLEMVRRQIYTVEELDVHRSYFEEFSQINPSTIQLIGLKHINLKQASDQIRQALAVHVTPEFVQESAKANEILVDVDFVHLHNHT